MIGHFDILTFLWQYEIKASDDKYTSTHSYTLPIYHWCAFIKRNTSLPSRHTANNNQRKWEFGESFPSRFALHFLFTVLNRNHYSVVNIFFILFQFGAVFFDGIFWRFPFQHSIIEFLFTLCLRFVFFALGCCCCLEFGTVVLRLLLVFGNFCP